MVLLCSIGSCEYSCYHTGHTSCFEMLCILVKEYYAKTCERALESCQSALKVDKEFSCNILFIYVADG